MTSDFIRVGFRQHLIVMAFIRQSLDVMFDRLITFCVLRSAQSILFTTQGSLERSIDDQHVHIGTVWNRLGWRSSTIYPFVVSSWLPQPLPWTRMPLQLIDELIDEMIIAELMDESTRRSHRRIINEALRNVDASLYKRKEDYMKRLHLRRIPNSLISSV